MRPVLLILAPLLLAAPIQAQTAASTAAQAEAPAYRTEDVRYPSGPLTLAALLMLPPLSPERVPAAVIVQGSGASDRSNAWARSIAEELVRAGVAVLLTDKRGSGASEGDWQTADFSDLAGDALSGVRFLRGRPEIDPGRVGLVGLSQGGWIVPLAAARSTDVAFVIDISGAAVSFAEQSFTEMGNTARQAGLPEEQVREVLELNRAVAEYLLTGAWERYRQARERALQRPWGKIAAGFPDSPDLPLWTFFRGVAGYDPMPYWIQLTEPVLVVYGEARRAGQRAREGERPPARARLRGRRQAEPPHRRHPGHRPCPDRSARAGADARLRGGLAFLAEGERLRRALRHL